MYDVDSGIHDILCWTEILMNVQTDNPEKKEKLIVD